MPHTMNFAPPWLPRKVERPAPDLAECEDQPRPATFAGEMGVAS